MTKERFLYTFISQTSLCLKIPTYSFLWVFRSLKVDFQRWQKSFITGHDEMVMAVCFMIVLLERSCIQSVLFLTTCLKLKKLESSHAQHCKIIPLSQFLLFIPLQKNRRKGDTATCLFYEHCGGWVENTWWWKTRLCTKICTQTLKNQFDVFACEYSWLAGHGG